MQIDIGEILSAPPPSPPRSQPAHSMVAKDIGSPEDVEFDDSQLLLALQSVGPTLSTPEIPTYMASYLSMFILKPEEKVMIFTYCPFTPDTVRDFLAVYPSTALANVAAKLETDLRTWQTTFVARNRRKPRPEDKAEIQPRLVLYHLIVACQKEFAGQIIARALRRALRRTPTPAPAPAPAPGLTLSRAPGKASVSISVVSSAPAPAPDDFSTDPLATVWRLYAAGRPCPLPSFDQPPHVVAAAAAALSPDEVLQERARLKTVLRRYDAWFSSTHGRPPARSDKEALRPAYNAYRRLGGNNGTGSGTGSDVDESDYGHLAGMAPVAGARWVLSVGKAEVCAVGSELLATRRRAINRLLRALKNEYMAGISSDTKADPSRRLELSQMSDTYYELLALYEEIKLKLK